MAPVLSADLDPQYVAAVGFKVSGGNKATRGKYLCDAASKVDGVCFKFVAKSGSATLLRTDGEANATSCWEIRLQAQPIYQQLISDAPKGKCQDLPATTSKTSTQWRKATTHKKYLKLQVAPQVTNGKILLGLLDTCFLCVDAFLRLSHLLRLTFLGVSFF